MLTQAHPWSKSQALLLNSFFSFFWLLSSGFMELHHSWPWKPNSYGWLQWVLPLKSRHQQLLFIQLSLRTSPPHFNAPSLITPLKSVLPFVFFASYHLSLLTIIVVQSISRVWLWLNWNAACKSSLSLTVSRSLLKPMSIKLMMPSSHLILCPPFPFLPSIFPSNMVFSNESALCIRWPNYWSFSFSLSPSNEYLGLISFKIDWFDLLAVRGTLKSLLQHHNLKASILQCSAFFVQLSHSYMTTGKIIALTIWTSVSKVSLSIHCFGLS